MNFFDELRRCAPAGLLVQREPSASVWAPTAAGDQRERWWGHRECARLTTLAGDPTACVRGRETAVSLWRLR
jgi:hypothetical protein